eukprot:XP_001708149.1 Hypothetical protein GL50803_35336 [Giardia lamblia ATCC 50803]
MLEAWNGNKLPTNFCWFVRKHILNLKLLADMLDKAVASRKGVGPRTNDQQVIQKSIK